MALGHFVIDANPAILFTLLPLFIAQLRLSFALAGLLTTSMLAASTVMQPLFGYVQDRLPLVPLAAVGLVVGGLGVGVTGLIGSYPLLLAAVIIAGLGSAAFHPQAVAQAGRASAPRQDWGIAIFFSGGSAGTALMSIIVVPLEMVVGMPATLVALLPGLVVGSLVLRSYRSWLRPPGPAASARARRRVAFPLALLMVVSVLRSAVVIAFLTFIPTLIVSRGGSVGLGALALAAFLLSGSVGALAGGITAGRIGSQLVVLSSVTLGFVTLLPMVGLAPATMAGWLVVAGVILFASEAQVTALAQRLLPSFAGLASSLMMGVGFGIGNLGAFMTGLIADHTGLAVALELTTLLLLGAIGAIAAYLAVEGRARVEVGS